MSAHADKTLHRKIYNINDTDTFPHILSLKIFEFVKKFFTTFVHEFKYEIEFLRIFLRENWLCYEWPVLYF